MNINKLNRRCVIGLLITHFIANSGFSKVEVYQWPSELQKGTKFTKLLIGPVESYVFKTIPDATKPTVVNEVSIFSFSGPQKIQVSFNDTIQSAVVRPKSKGITPAIEGNIITFTLNSPENLCREVNGNRNYPLLFLPIRSKPINLHPPTRQRIMSLPGKLKMLALWK